MLELLFMTGDAKASCGRLWITTTIIANLGLVLMVGSAIGQDTPGVKVSNALIKVDREVDLCFEVGGIVDSVDIKEGDVVREGQTLATLRDTQVKFELKRRQFELTNARTEAKNQLAIEDARLAAAVAESEYNRVLEANRTNPKTYRGAEVERFKLLADRSKLAVKQAEHDAKVKRVDELLAENEWEAMVATAEQYKARAPWAGTIVAVDKVVGEWVEPGTKIGRLIDTSRLRVEGFVSYEYEPATLLDAEAVVSLVADKGEPMSVKGKVVFVSPDINPVNLLAHVYIEIDNQQGRLRPGSKANVVIRPLQKAANLAQKNNSSAGE